MGTTAPTYALITGASAGIGREFAKELATRKYNLILVSLPGTGLGQQGESLKKRFKTDVRIIETDLMVQGNHEKVKEYILSENLPLSLLINNVGLGHNGEIGTYTTRKINEMVLLNVATTTLMTNLLVPELKKSPRAYILNMGSFGGFMPLAYKSIYSATKSYVYHFSVSLAAELKGTGVQVSVALPGPVPTNDLVKDRIDKSGRIAREIILPADRVAAFTLEKMFAGKQVIIPGRGNRMMYYFGNLIPYGLLRIMLQNRFRGQE